MGTFDSKFLELSLEVAKNEISKALERDRASWGKIYNLLLKVYDLFKKFHSQAQVFYRSYENDEKLLDDLIILFDSLKKELSKMVLKNLIIKQWVDDCLSVIDQGKKNQLLPSYIIVDLLHTIGLSDYTSFDASGLNKIITISRNNLVKRIYAHFLSLSCYKKIVVIFFSGIPIKLIIAFICETYDAWFSIINCIKNMVY